MNPRTGIVIVEDMPALRDSLVVLLNGEPTFEVLGAWGSAEEALQALPGIRPGILLVDMGLPGMQGIELIEKARAMLPELEVMAYTISDKRETVLGALKAGAGGYVLKGATPRELIEALHSLREGGAPMSPRIARAIIREFQAPASAAASPLTSKEKEVLSAINDGLAYKEVAEKLCMSIHTVHTHLKRIYEKLHARNSREAVMKARQDGLI